MIKTIDEIYANERENLEKNYFIDRSYILELEIKSPSFQSVNFFAHKRGNKGTTFLLYEKDNNRGEYISDVRVSKYLSKFYDVNVEMYEEVNNAFFNYLNDKCQEYTYSLNGRTFVKKGISKLDKKFESNKIELNSGLIIHINDLIDLINLIFLKEKLKEKKTNGNMLLLKYFCSSLLISKNPKLQKYREKIFKVLADELQLNDKKKINSIFKSEINFIEIINYNDYTNSRS